MAEGRPAGARRGGEGGQALGAPQAHRKRRERPPPPGMLPFRDGSPHVWLPDLGAVLDLVVTMDDATGAIYSAFLVEEEDTMSSFRGLAETIAAKGLFASLYTDRGSH